MLKSLYAIAIALLVAAFVGFGIAAFYPEPDYRGLSGSAFQQTYSNYNLVVASLSIGFAVLLLVASLLWMSRLPVIGDGATLGAVFTLFYGLIRALMTESAQFRFIAVAVGLVVLLVLVYLRFIRSSKSGLSTQFSRDKPA